MRIPQTRYALVAMLALGMALLGPALPGGVVGAVTVSVPCNTTALIAAVADPANDVINLAAACTYTLTTVNNSSDGPNGLPDIARTLTINGNGAIIERAGGTRFRIFHVAGAGNLTLGDVTIRNGYSPDGEDGSFSGDNGDRGTNGGGIYNLGTLALNAAILSGNTSGNGGNGADNEGEEEEAGDGGYGGNGGGIYNLGTLTVTASTLSGNATGQGGAAGTGTGGAENGISVDAGYGGGIYNEGTLTVARSTISGNITGSLNSEGGCGGAIGSEGGTVTIVNSTLSGNTAHNCGGAMNAAGTATTIINSTITGNILTNVAFGGGGISAFFGTVHLSNTIIAGNTSTLAGTEDCYQFTSGATISDGHNLVGSGTGCPSGGTGDLTVIPANVYTTVLSATLAANDGPTQTHALLSTSPAVNAGDPATCAAAPVSGVDQRGFGRPAGAACDIGAFELRQRLTTLSQVRGTATYGGTATLTATLTETGNLPVAGATVTFTLGGTPVGGATTNAQGVATLSGVPLPAGTNAGTYANRVCASFAGDTNHLATGPTCGPLVVGRVILWLKPVDRNVGLKLANPPTDPHLDPATCPAPSYCLELTRGSAFVNGQSWAALNLAALRFQYARNPPSTNATEYVGKTYRITAFGASSSNYDIRYDPGTLTVR